MDGGPQRLEALLRQLEAERKRLQQALDAGATRVIDFDRMIQETRDRIERTKARIESEKSSSVEDQRAD